METEKALVYLKNTISFDKSEDFSKIAKQEISKIRLQSQFSNK